MTQAGFKLVTSHFYFSMFCEPPGPGTAATFWEAGPGHCCMSRTSSGSSSSICNPKQKAYKAFSTISVGPFRHCGILAPPPISANRLFLWTFRTSFKTYKAIHENIWIRQIETLKPEKRQIAVVSGSQDSLCEATGQNSLAISWVSIV